MDTYTRKWLTIDGLSKWLGSIHLAVSMGELQRVEHMINRGVNINEARFGHTPLEMALIRGMDEISLLLLRTEGIRVKSRKEQTSLLDLAVERSSIVVLTKLFNYPMREIFPKESSQRDLINHVCVMGRADVLELISTRLPYVEDKHPFEFLRCEPCPFKHIPVTNFLLQNGFYQIEDAEKLKTFLSHGHMHSNLFKLIICNWDKICPSIEMYSSHGQKVLFSVLKAAMHDNDISKIFEIHRYINLSTIRGQFQSISPHEFCVWKEDALFQLLDALSATIDPFFMYDINKVLQHCVACTWSKPRSVIRKIYSIWNKTFTLYRGFLYLYIFCAQGLNHIVPCERAIQFAWDGLDEAVLIRLYNLIKSAMFDAFRENVNLIRYIEPNLLEKDIEGKRISLIKYACQSMETIRVLEKRTKICFRENSKLKEYFEWYEEDKWKKTKLKVNSPKLTSASFSYLKDKIDKYDYLPEKQMLVNCLKHLFNCMLKTIARENPLFECSSKIVGSFREGTRPFKPDEYDLLLILDKFLTYVDLEDMGSNHAYVVDMKLRTEFIGDKRFEGITDSNGYITADLKTRLDKLVQKSLCDIFKHGTYGDHLVIEPNYGQFGPISNIQLIWRGTTFKDMKVFVDLVPVLPYADYKPQFIEDYIGNTLHVFLKPTKTSIGKLEVIGESRVVYEHDFRFSTRFNVAYSEYEIRSIGKLPLSLRTGYRIAKAIRIMPLFPDFILNQLHHVDNIEDYLPTYMLKTAVLFIANVAKLTSIYYLEPDQWAYLIYVHVRERLLDGLISLWWDIRPRWVTRHTEACFQCGEPLNIKSNEMLPCCIRRKNLLIITSWLKDILEANLKTSITKDIEEDFKDLRTQGGKFLDMVYSGTVKK